MVSLDQKLLQGEDYNMLLASEKASVITVLSYLKRIGVPEDGRWQTLILYLRYISDYNYLTLSQKQQIQELLISVIKKKKFDFSEYNRVNKRLGDILFEPYKNKLSEVLNEFSELVKKFAEVSQLRKKHIENLEQKTIDIIEKTDDIELAIKKIKKSFKNVINILDEDIRKLYEDVKLDGLTSLYNRKFLDIYLDSILKKCSKNKLPFCVLMFDIDDFKNINDKYGHRVGDQALIIVSRIIKGMCEKFLIEKNKGNLFPARYGGEEFCILSEGLDSKEGFDLAEKIRKSVERYNFIVRDCDGEVIETGVKITISGGVSSTYDGQKSGEELIDEADRAMYRAKRSGKNRVEVYRSNG